MFSLRSRNLGVYGIRRLVGTSTQSEIKRKRLSSARFRVRQLKTADEVERFVFSKITAALGRRPGALDHLSYFAADPTGFFVGELNGDVISCITAVKYSKDYAFLGNFNVDKLYQGGGYGLATWKAALSSLTPGCNIAGATTEYMLPMYTGEPFGLNFKYAWKNQRFSITAFEGAMALASASASTSNENFKIRAMPEVPFGDVVDYDTSVHVYARPAFLKQWTYAPNCHAYAATNDNGVVVGYAVVRTLAQDCGWQIGPLFANNSHIARNLYKAVFSGVSNKDPTANVIVDVPFGDIVNPEAVQIMTKELSAPPTLTTLSLHSKEVRPPMQLHKMYALTSLSL